MKKTIRNKIFTFNLLTVLLLIIITAIAFTIFARSYLQSESLEQLNHIASGVERAIVGPHRALIQIPEGRDLISSYVSLLRILRAPTSIFNVEYALVDRNNLILTPYKDFADNPTDQQLQIIDNILRLNNENEKKDFIFSFEGIDYVSVITEVREDNRFNLGKIIIYTNLEKINQMQKSIIYILLGILVFSSVIVMIFSSFVTKNISSPLSRLCGHIRDLSERKFSSRFQMPADNEIQELVNNINAMAESLESHDKSQKTFLQNASHEFRTPIMSIQSYAEGIKYDVIDGHEAADVILAETKRLTHMVEELLYLSRLDAIEEKYDTKSINMADLIQECMDRIEPIAIKLQKKIVYNMRDESATIIGDSEKLERAILNIITNCVRFAESEVSIKTGLAESNDVEILISDDGPGFTDEDLKNIFTRFYKGLKGEIGLGLAIAKTIIEKHHGLISASNISKGAIFRIILPHEINKSL